MIFYLSLCKNTNTKTYSYTTNVAQMGAICTFKLSCNILVLLIFLLTLNLQYKTFYTTLNYVYIMKLLFLILLQIICPVVLLAQQHRQELLFNDGWKFSLGNASNMHKDFMHGTEYFTYLSKTKAHNQNRGPSWINFNDSTWQNVTLPHDWVVDLPYNENASHSHGYKMIGWKFPENSIGWYRKQFIVPNEWKGQHIYIKFEGIYRNSQVFCNGFYMGHEISGYATKIYDLTEYIEYGKKNVLTIRADASMEEGWYYEGAGIYRNVYLISTPLLHVEEAGISTICNIPEIGVANIEINANIKNDSSEDLNYTIVNHLIDESGNEVGKSITQKGKIKCRTSKLIATNIQIKKPKLWDIYNPYLYTLKTEVSDNQGNIDITETKIGIRTIDFDANKGFILNGKQVKLKGVNIHLDHAGVGTGIPDELWRYRISKLKELGVNAIRSSHNPASPSMLDICDREGILVINENRLMGINDEHINLLTRMIKRDQNHPCIILWSIGNEEWAIENKSNGYEIARTMCNYVKTIDPTRPTTAGIAGGQILLRCLDVKGYNYIRNNHIDRNHELNPDWKSIGTEETSGCGTRGVYFTNNSEGWMASINRTGDKDGVINVIERGLKFYSDREWLGGLFYWTGFDYRGEPNPMKYPATGSQYGILDYCGFPKDEAYYLRSWWTETPTLHILPHWNLKGHENENIEIWAYTNCDKVNLIVNGKELGMRNVPKNGHVSWNTIYKPGKVTAIGYKNDKKILEKNIETTGKAISAILKPHKTKIKADGQDIIVVDISLFDNKGRFVPDACEKLTASISGPIEILGFGNGNPSFKQKERPTTIEKTFKILSFNGNAQLILRSQKGKIGKCLLNISSSNIKSVSLELKSEI